MQNESYKSRCYYSEQWLLPWLRQFGSDNAYTLNGVRITRRADGGLQVLYPHLAEREGKHRQIFAFKPMNPIAHKRIEQAVLSAYKEELRKTGSTSGF